MISLPNIIRLCRVIVLIPLYAIYGTWSLVMGLLRVRGLLGDTRRLLGESLVCPSCHTPNSLVGRWSCSVCSAVYHGAAVECPYCGAGASFITCERCSVSIPMRSWR
jgi:rubredoxin